MDVGEGAFPAACLLVPPASLIIPSVLQALLYSAEEIIKTCVNVIARNFSYIYNADYNVLPYEYVRGVALAVLLLTLCVLTSYCSLLVSILEHPCLAVKAMGEWSLFQIVREYIKQHTELTYEARPHLIIHVWHCLTAFFPFRSNIVSMVQFDIGGCQLMNSRSSKPPMLCPLILSSRCAL